MIRRLSAILPLLIFMGAGGSCHALAAPSLARTALLEDNIVYLRVNQIGATTADEITTANSSLAGTNKVIGTVLDLRATTGDDASILKSMADVFSAKKLPLTILVDADTQGTATALAAKLRQSRLGLIFGSPTLGLKPDVTVNIDTNSEKLFLQDPYATIPAADTNSVTGTNSFPNYVDHTSEAELVRERRKDGADDDSTPAVPRAEPPKPVIHDPVLARAVDLIKGLAVIRASRG